MQFFISSFTIPIGKKYTLFFAVLCISFINHKQFILKSLVYCLVMNIYDVFAKHTFFIQVVVFK